MAAAGALPGFAALAPARFRGSAAFAAALATFPASSAVLAAALPIRAAALAPALPASSAAALPSPAVRFAERAVFPTASVTARTAFSVASAARVAAARTRRAARAGAVAALEAASSSARTISALVFRRECPGPSTFRASSRRASTVILLKSVMVSWSYNQHRAGGSRDFAGRRGAVTGSVVPPSAGRANLAPRCRSGSVAAEGGVQGPEKAQDSGGGPAASAAAPSIRRRARARTPALTPRSTATARAPTPRSTRRTRLLGTQVGSFRIVRMLGRGGMGTVYLAEHPVIGSQVAIKFLHESMASDSSLVRRFFDEARAVNLIGHENIVGIYDLSRLPPGRYYFVMEYLEGETLADAAAAGARAARGGARRPAPALRRARRAPTSAA